MKNIIKFAKLGFDNDKYFKLQMESIIQRKENFKNRLYFEIGGHFTFDSHAARVLPGFQPANKVQILHSIKDLDIIYCISSNDIETNRQFDSISEDYRKYLIKQIQEIEASDLPTPKIAINLFDENHKSTQGFIRDLKKLGYQVYKRFPIDGYPNDLDKIASQDGYGKDEYIEVAAEFVAVIGPGSNSGKMSTCLGQVYHENIKGIDSGYAKYETFPIWNIPLEHPVNYAYEAGTADIGDYNALDINYFHKFARRSVNYNRDIEAFPIVKNLCRKVVGKDNFMNSYSSPTEMGISNAGFAITDNEVVKQASKEEIIRRYFWEKYKETESKDLKPAARIETIMKKLEMEPEEIEVVKVARKENKIAYRLLDKKVEIFSSIQDLFKNKNETELIGAVLHSPNRLAIKDRIKLTDCGIVFTDE